MSTFKLWAKRWFPRTHARGPVGGLTYGFDFDGDGAYEVSNATGVARHAFADNGTYPVSVRVTDALGAATGSTAAVVTNVAPTLTGFTVTPAVTEGGTAFASGTV